MIENFIFYLELVMVIILTIMIAKKLKIAYPILLVIVGLLISLIPGMRSIKIEPELIFIIFLPPVLYEAAFQISWKELWKLRRTISSFAFIITFLSAISIAFVANAIVPGFSLAMGFVIGGIVSAPDTVSTGAILKYVKVPKNYSTFLEGESLFNNASSLIIFRFAMVAVATGQLIWQDTAISFSWIIIGGISIGLAIAFIFLQVHKYFSTSVNTDIILSLVTPYIMYITAEEVHSSGVIAVVTGGLFLSLRRHQWLKTSESRLKEFNFWESFTFLINGIVFLIIGLDLPEIIEGLESDGTKVWEAIAYGLIFTIILMMIRLLSTYGGVTMTLILRNFIKIADRDPERKGPLLFGWAGMRGVVSLLAALSIPLTLENGQPFPNRDLILFLTLVVVVSTLIFQGLTLRALIIWLEIDEVTPYHLSEKEANKVLRKGMRETALSYLLGNFKSIQDENIHIEKIKNRCEKNDDEYPLFTFSKKEKKIYLETMNKQREYLRKENRENPLIDEEFTRRNLLKLDLEEEQVRLQ